MIGLFWRVNQFNMTITMPLMSFESMDITHRYMELDPTCLTVLSLTIPTHGSTAKGFLFILSQTQMIY